MKLKLILISTIAILLTSLYIGYIKYVKVLKERDAQYVNTEQALLDAEKKDKIILITEAQLYKYIESNKALADSLKKEKIKPKRVEYITKVKHVYLPSDTVVKIENVDTMLIARYNDGCLSLDNYIDIENLTLSVKNVKYNTEITHIAYQKKKDVGRRVLLVFKIRKKFLELHTFSSCGTNTVEQLKVIKE